MGLDQYHRRPGSRRPEKVLGPRRVYEQIDGSQNPVGRDRGDLKERRDRFVHGSLARCPRRRGRTCSSCGGCHRGGFEKLSVPHGDGLSQANGGSTEKDLGRLGDRELDKARDQ
jgi:hypothetical protein